MKQLLLLICVIASPISFAKEAEFFNQLSKLCGKTMLGKSVFPTDPNDSFFGKPLIIKVASCTADEIRVPLKVGMDTSRTWIISKTPNGLQLKHDHRHPDGTPDEVTMYGGLSDKRGTQFSQSFTADEETQKVVPEGKTNIWTISIDYNKQQLSYFLSRHNKPRFHAIFGLDQKFLEE